MTDQDQSEAVTGGCFCGAVRYEARAYLKSAYYCHCRMCQRSNGAPADVGVFVEVGTLRFTKGEPRFFQSSPFAERGFCATCGSRLLWRPLNGEHPEWINLSVGCLDHPERVVPIRHQGVEARLPWFDPDPALPHLRSDEIPEIVESWKGKV
jgi:hypothetical protein